MAVFHTGGKYFVFFKESPRYFTNIPRKDFDLQTFGFGGPTFYPVKLRGRDYSLAMPENFNASTVRLQDDDG